MVKDLTIDFGNGKNTEFLLGITKAADEVLAEFEKMPGLGYKTMIASLNFDGLTLPTIVRFDYHVQRTLKTFPCMERYYQACILHVLDGIVRMGGYTSGWDVKEICRGLGIDNKQFRFIWGFPMWQA